MLYNKCIITIKGDCVNSTINLDIHYLYFDIQLILNNLVLALASLASSKTGPSMLNLIIFGISYELREIRLLLRLLKYMTSKNQSKN